ncbi:MAG: ParB N-terminal domain-containing protein [Desulfovibrio sp.]|nr:ParB N-terminal domain-containing protein [Desulfovibrio sp.]
MAKPRKMVDFSGLDKVANLNFNAAPQVPAVLASDGRPLEIPLDEIREDSSQPRSIFDADTLKELAASIESVGLLEPVSVRPDPAGRLYHQHGREALSRIKAGR